MLEKIISLADISLIDFLGVSNANLQALMNAFPQTKIIARGEQLTIRGSDDQISLVEAIVNQCIAHLESHSSLSVKYMTLFIDGVLSKIDNAVDGECATTKGTLIQLLLLCVGYLILDLLVKAEWI